MMAVVPDSLEKSEITFFIDNTRSVRPSDRLNASGDYVQILPYVRVRTFDSGLGNETDEYFMPLKMFLPLVPFNQGIAKTCIEFRPGGPYPFNTGKPSKGTQELHEYRDI
jgi:hypothetical protein